MGRTSTPKYVVRVTVPGYSCTPMEWRVSGRYGMKGYGAPNDANLAKFVEASNASTEPGGVNSHLGAAHKIVAAEVFLNDGKYDVALASWYKPVIGKVF